MEVAQLLEDDHMKLVTTVSLLKCVPKFTSNIAIQITACGSTVSDHKLLAMDCAYVLMKKWEMHLLS